MLDKLKWRLHRDRRRAIEVDIVDRAQEGWYWADVYIVYYVNGYTPADVVTIEKVNRTVIPEEQVSSTQANVATKRMKPGYVP